MISGKVKFFNATKGFGFIQPDQGGEDAFVHISAVERAGMATLVEGQAVSYELESGRDGLEDIASEHGLACEILERDAIEARGMGAYLGVAQGSKPGEGDPRFIHLTYTPEVPPPQSYRASRVLV